MQSPRRGSGCGIKISLLATEKQGHFNASMMIALTGEPSEFSNLSGSAAKNTRDGIACNKAKVGETGFAAVFVVRVHNV